jgi:hypothetical protein
MASLKMLFPLAAIGGVAAAVTRLVYGSVQLYPVVGTVLGAVAGPLLMVGGLGGGVASKSLSGVLAGGLMGIAAMILAPGLGAVAGGYAASKQLSGKLFLVGLVSAWAGGMIGGMLAGDSE